MKKKTRRPSADGQQAIPFFANQPESQTQLVRAPGFQYRTWFAVTMFAAAAAGVYAYPGSMSVAELAFIQWALNSAIFVASNPLHNQRS